jgi:amidase
MRYQHYIMVAAALLVTALTALPASAEEQWVVRTDFWGVPAYYTLTLDSDEDQLAGDMDGEPVNGSLAGQVISFSAGEEEGSAARYSGVLSGDEITGTASYVDGNNPDMRNTHDFHAWRIPSRLTSDAQTHDYSPTDYSNTFDADRRPVLTIWPGDTVRTTTIDSGGIDENGITRALFGNPLTGPFFIVGAEAGDTLVIHLRDLTLNRDYADSLDSIVRRALGSRHFAEASGLGSPVRWTIDQEAGVAWPNGATGALAGFSVPLRPMLGGLGVAPGFGWPAITSGDTGRFGGNMDFPEIVEGNTVYLTVQRPGALLYLGDAHAAQGEGETSQYGLETSMSVEFTVDLIKGQSIGMPRVESPTQIMVLGQAGTMEDALLAASSDMTEVLQRDYGLTLSETAQVMGSAMQYSVVNLAGRNIGIAAKIDKALLPPSLQILSRPIQQLRTP